MLSVFSRNICKLQITGPETQAMQKETFPAHFLHLKQLFRGSFRIVNVVCELPGMGTRFIVYCLSYNLTF